MCVCQLTEADDRYVRGAAGFLCVHFNLFLSLHKCATLSRDSVTRFFASKNQNGTYGIIRGLEEDDS